MIRSSNSTYSIFLTKKKIRNWSQYNRALVQRGNIAIWLSEDAIENWTNTDKHGGRGRSNQFSDLAIETCLTLRAVFKLPLRALEGLLIRYLV